MWQLLFLLTYQLMWSPSRLCAWSSTLHYVHISSQYPYFISFIKSPPVCWRHTTFPVFSSLTHLQNALQHLSSWRTANLLTLNSSKMEFLLIGLQKQLAKIHNCSLNTTDSAPKLPLPHLLFTLSLITATLYNFP